MHNTSRARRSLLPAGDSPRRSPRISAKDVGLKSAKKRVPTPPRSAPNIIIGIDKRHFGGENQCQEEEEERPLFEVVASLGATVRSCYAGLCDRLNCLKDKDSDKRSRSGQKRNLLAVFVLIPILLCLLYLIAQPTLDSGGTFGPWTGLTWAADSARTALFSLPEYIVGSSKSKSSSRDADIDLLVDKLLANEAFRQSLGPKKASLSDNTVKVEALLRDVQQTKKSAEDQLALVKKHISMAAEQTDNVQLQSLGEEIRLATSQVSQMARSADIKKVLDQVDARLLDLDRRHAAIAASVADCKASTHIEAVLQDQQFLERLKSLFASQEDVEMKLKEASDSLKIDLKKQLDKEAPVMNERIEMALKKSVGGRFSKADVVDIVHEALTVYDADKTGQFDFALESAGGTIASTRCTQTYDVSHAVYSVWGVPVWWQKPSPRTILQPGSSPGQCWAFKGTEGSVVVRLSNSVRVTAVTLEHIPRSLSPDGNVASAPKQFTVLALDAVDDPEPTVLGNFTYDADAHNPVQTFTTGDDDDRHWSLVELKVLSNYGHTDYTCIYRFRVHGVLVNT